MRDWNLGPTDPLALAISADFRLEETNIQDDQTWELEMGDGEPPALALYTTFGLRARSMRVFPRFLVGKQALCAPSDFATPPRLRAFYPNFLHLTFSPVETLEITAEYWKPSPQVVAGRWTLVNRADSPLAVTLEQCALLVPLEGSIMAPTSRQLVDVLIGSSGGLSLVLFLTGGPRPGVGPYPALALDLLLDPNAPRTLTWSLAALDNADAAFESARRTAARPWEAERAQIELLHASQTVAIESGDPDWDAALALSQKEALRLLLSATTHLPFPSFVLTRRPEHGYSLRADGKDQPSSWRGQSPLEAYYLASLLPGAPQIAYGLLENFLAVQREDGFVDCRPGLAGQRGQWLAAPLLASLAWNVYRRRKDKEFLESAFPKLAAFYRIWFSSAYDRDADGFPEWQNPGQHGPEEHPVYSVWRDGSVPISAVEDPALGALLYREGRILARIADLLERPVERETIERLAEAMRANVEACWNAASACYRRRDFASHFSPGGIRLLHGKGDRIWEGQRTFETAARLLVRLQLDGTGARQPEIILYGREGRRIRREYLRRPDFQWNPGCAVATTRDLFTSLHNVEIRGLTKRDSWSVAVMDCAREDCTLLLPLWAEIPDSSRARALVNRTLLAPRRFGRPFGIPVLISTSRRARKTASDWLEEIANYGCYLPWIHLIGEGLLSYGWREETALLLERVMAAVIRNLQKRHSFFQAYHAESGDGLGERGHLGGLAPVGLFLETLGVQFIHPLRVVLRGKNPFPWPVVVQYKGTRVTRCRDETTILFVNGQSVTLQDPTDMVVSVER